MKAKTYKWSEVREEKFLNNKLSRRYIAGQNEMLGLMGLKKGCTVQVHRHHNEQFTYVLKGALKFTLEDSKVVLREGEVIHLPSNVPHGAEAMEDTLELDIFTPPREDWLTGKDDYLRKAS